VYALYLLSEEGPNASLSWLLWLVLIVFLLIVLIGWWVSRNKGSQPEVRPETLGEKLADDLKALEGIGPKVEKLLNSLGIMSFADLAGADSIKVQEALNAAGMQYMNPEGWIEQAGLAAKGDMEGLMKLQDELKGGRKIS